MLLLDEHVVALRGLSRAHAHGRFYSSAAEIRCYLSEVEVEHVHSNFDATIKSQLWAANSLLDAKLRSDNATHEYHLKPYVVTVVRTLPICNVCGMQDVRTESVADAFIPAYRTWGYVCRKHFTDHRCWLGLCRGQILVTDDWSSYTAGV